MTHPNRELVERFTDAHVRKDRKEGATLLHPDFELSWPQSGEVIRGADNWRAVFENPNLERGGLRSARIFGTDDVWVMAPNYTVLRTSGGGDTYTVEGTVEYPNGEIWCYVAIVELRDGAIWRETDYFAAPFDPAPWRAPWVELMPR